MRSVYRRINSPKPHAAVYPTVNLSGEETIHCGATVKNDVNLNLTYFQPMGVVRLQFYLCRLRHMETHAVWSSSGWVMVWNPRCALPILFVFNEWLVCVISISSPPQKWKAGDKLHAEEVIVTTRPPFFPPLCFMKPPWCLWPCHKNHTSYCSYHDTGCFPIHTLHLYVRTRRRQHHISSW